MRTHKIGMRQMVFALAWFTTLNFANAPKTLADATLDTERGAIVQLIRSTWEKPDQPINVTPVVVAHNFAVAGWLQGNRGGRALLKRSDGRWAVILCSGDGIRSETGLTSAGVPSKIAVDLAQRLSAEESKLPTHHVAQFATFEGTIEMPGHHAGDHHTHHKQAQP